MSLLHRFVFVPAVGLAFSLLAAPAAARAAEPAELAAGCEPLGTVEPFERELQGGASHCYSVTLSEGQHLHLVVDQIDVDVVAAFAGPDGKGRLEVDGPTADKGQEPVWFVAGAAGEHRLELRSISASVRPGRYRVSVRTLRPANARDRLLAEAQALHGQADRLLGESKAESRQEALVVYQKALGLWEQADEPPGEARTLFMMALAENAGGDSTAALRCLERGLALMSRMNEPALEATTLQDLGNVHQRLGDAPTALRCFDRAEAIFRRIGSRLGESSIAASRGQLHVALGDLQRALDAHGRSLELNRTEANASIFEGVALNNVAYVYAELGELERAMALYEEALPLLRAREDRLNQGITLNNLGRLHTLRGEPPKALGLLEQSLSLRREIGDRFGEGVTLFNIGAALGQMGDAAGARDHYQQSLALRRAAGDRQGEALTLTSIGSLQAQAGETDKAFATFDKALSIRRSIGDRRGEADTRYGIARLERDQGRLAEARESIAAALLGLEALRADVQSRELRASFLGSRREYYELEIDVLMRLHEREPSQRIDLEALRTSEAARARSLLDLLADANAEIREGTDAALHERERSLRQHIVSLLDRQVRLLAGEHSEAEAIQVAQEVAYLSAEHEAVLAQARAASPRYAGLTQPRILAAPEIQSLLDDETVLVEYALGDERSYAWVVLHDQVWSFTLPARAAIESAARALHDRLEQLPRDTGGVDPRLAESASRLSDLILAPLAGRLSRKRLVFAGEGALQVVPLGLLPVNGVPLVADHEIVSLPSASVLAALRQTIGGRSVAPKTLAVLADPVFEADDPRVRDARRSAPDPVVVPASVRGAARGTGQRLSRLLFSRREARDVLGLVPAADRKELLDFDASLTTVTSPEMAQYRILHLATHGVLNSAHPELSGIVLSLVDRQGRPQQGFLSAFDVFNLRLSADLVVLSACRSALGKQIRGEGLVGLTRAFMYAGAPRIVASLWTVDDAATAALMKRFYQGLLGPERLSAAAALNRAQQDVRRQRRWQHPYYWAGFILQGEWR